MPRRKRPELNIGLKPPERDQRQEWTPWQTKVKWQMEQARIGGNRARYRQLLAKLRANTAKARDAKRRKNSGNLCKTS